MSVVFLHPHQDKDHEIHDSRQIAERLHFIEQSFVVLSSKVDNLLYRNGAVAGRDAPDMQSQLEDVAIRMNRLELLLLHTPLPDFKVLDDTIAALDLKASEKLKFTLNEAPFDTTKHSDTSSRESDVNISINPDYIDRFCIDEFEDHEEPTHDHLHSVTEKRTHAERICPRSRLDSRVLEESEDSGDSEEALDADVVGERRLEQLVAKVEKGDLDIDDLTEEEAKHFRSQLKIGSLGCSWSSWDPWWQRADVDLHSEPLARERVGSSSIRSDALKRPAHICCTGGRNPHTSVAFTALSALYAYVHTMHAFKGGWEWAPLEASPHLLHLCPIICSHQVYTLPEECLRASLQAATSLPNGGFGSDFDRLCLIDLHALIFGGAETCAYALQGVQEIFQACLAGGGSGCCGKLRRGMKKLDFLISFVFHHFELLQPLAAVAARFAGELEVQRQAGTPRVLGSMSIRGMD